MNTPYGIYVVHPVNDPNLATEAAWTDPNIVGVLIRTTWANVETSPGNLDWSYLDQGIALGQQYNKQIQLSIDFGQSSPDWVYTLGAKQWFVHGESGGVGKGNDIPMPEPWDPVFLSRISTVIAAFGARYGNNPIVQSITMWAGGHGIETYFAQSAQDQAALDAIGGPSVWITAAQSVIDMYAAAFPNNNLYMATGVAYPDGNATTSVVANYFMNTYWNQSGLQSNGLSDKFPPASVNTFAHTTIPYSSIRSIGYQLVGTVKKAGALSDVIANGKKCGAEWIQVYPTDPSSDPNEASIIAFNAATKPTSYGTDYNSQGSSDVVSQTSSNTVQTFNGEQPASTFASSKLTSTTPVTAYSPDIRNSSSQSSFLSSISGNSSGGQNSLCVMDSLFNLINQLNGITDSATGAVIGGINNAISSINSTINGLTGKLTSLIQGVGNMGSLNLSVNCKCMSFDLSTNLQQLLQPISSWLTNFGGGIGQITNPFSGLQNPFHLNPSIGCPPTLGAYGNNPVSNQ